MCNSRPVVRVGQTLDISLEGMRGTTPVEQTWLSVNDAPLIAWDAYRGAKKIAGHVASVLESTFHGSTATLVDGRGTISNDRGLIVDPPGIDFVFGDFRHRIGLSLTVCMPSTRSKLWFRSQCDGVRNGTQFDDPIGMDGKPLSDFFGDALDLAEVALSALRQDYAASVQHVIGDDVSVELKPSKEFRFRVFDSNGDRLAEEHNLEKFFKDLEAGASLTSTLQSYKKISGPAAKPHPAMVAIELGAKENLQGAELLDALKKSDDHTRIITHRDRGHRPGLFISVTDDSGDLPIVDFTGFAYDPASRDQDRAAGSTPSLRLTAQLLASLVRDHDREFAEEVA